ncbi:MAG: DUF4124 domain-containing protein [Rhodanobacter sp.]
MRLRFPLIFLILVACSAPAAAQTAIHRCVGEHGQPVFTDQPCAVLHAVPAVPKVVRDAGEGIHPVPVMCAVDRQALQKAVAAAFANHDANRLAGLMLWRGYGSRAAVADIRSLGDLVNRTLLDFGSPPRANDSESAPADTGDDPYAQETAAAAAAPSNQLVLHTRGRSADVRETRFTLVRRSGCLWLQATAGGN